MGAVKLLQEIQSTKENLKFKKSEQDRQQQGLSHHKLLREVLLTYQHHYTTFLKYAFTFLNLQDDKKRQKIPCMAMAIISYEEIPDLEMFCFAK